MSKTAKKRGLLTNVEFEKVYLELLEKGGTFKQLCQRFPKRTPGALRQHIITLTNRHSADGKMLQLLKTSRDVHRT